MNKLSMSLSSLVILLRSLGSQDGTEGYTPFLNTFLLSEQMKSSSACLAKSHRVHCSSKLHSLLHMSCCLEMSSPSRFSSPWTWIMLENMGTGPGPLFYLARNQGMTDTVIEDITAIRDSLRLIWDISIVLCHPEVLSQNVKGK